MKNQNLWVHCWVLFCIAVWLFTIFGLCGCQFVTGGEPDEVNGRVTFLDVGQGLAVLLEYDGHYALYDSGPDSAGLVDSLKNRGVDSLDWLLLSHNHRDHLGGALELLHANESANGKIKNDKSEKSAFRIGRLLVGPDTSGGFLVDSVLRMAHRQKISIDTVVRGDRIYLGKNAGSSKQSAVNEGGLRLDCLWPPAYMRLGENTASVVLRVGLADEFRVASEASRKNFTGAVLLTGDLDSLGEMRLLEISPDVSAGLLQVGHHGSAHSSTLKFLNQVSPREAVISVGKRNSYGHPAEPVLRKLQYVLGDSTAIRRTDKDGTVHFQLVPDVGVVEGE